ncbi:hypothetical protein BC830DRAFT_1233307, partial [Chytriomyces sp. MP71]
MYSFAQLAFWQLTFLCVVVVDAMPTIFNIRARSVLLPSNERSHTLVRRASSICSPPWVSNAAYNSSQIVSYNASNYQSLTAIQASTYPPGSTPANYGYWTKVSACSFTYFPIGDPTKSVCIQSQNAATTVGNPVVIYGYGGSPQAMWAFDTAGHLVNQLSNNCMGGAVGQAGLTLVNCNTAPTWNFSSSGVFTMKERNLCIQSPGLTWGPQVTVNTCGASGQSWTYNCDPATYVQIQMKGMPYVANVASVQNGSAITLYSNTSAQNAMFGLDCGNRLASKSNPSLCWGASSISSGSPLSLVSCTSNSAISWTMDSNNQLHPSTNQAYCLDDNNSGTTDGNQLQLWGCYAHYNQYWTYTIPQAASKAAPISCAPSTFGWMQLNGQPYVANAATLQSGSAITLYSISTAQNPQVGFDCNNKLVTMSNQALCWGASSGASNTSLALVSCTDSTAFTWTIDSTGVHPNGNSNMCLDDFASRTVDGNNVGINSCSGNSNQIWSFNTAMTTTTSTTSSTTRSTSTTTSTTSSMSSTSTTRSTSTTSTTSTTSST